MLLALCALPFALALWQWQRGEARSAELAAFIAGGMRAVPVLTALAQAAPPDGRRVQLSGRRDGAALWWRQGGSWRVWLPLRLGDGSRVLADIGQGALPAVLPAAVAGIGRWQRLPRVYTLPGARRGAAGEVDAPDAAALTAMYPQLRAGVVVLEAPLAGLAASPAKPPFDPRRHYGYALQWLLLGLVLLPLAWRLQRANQETR